MLLNKVESMYARTGTQIPRVGGKKASRPTQVKTVEIYIIKERTWWISASVSACVCVLIRVEEWKMQKYGKRQKEIYVLSCWHSRAASVCTAIFKWTIFITRKYNDFYPSKVQTQLQSNRTNKKSQAMAVMNLVLCSTERLMHFPPGYCWWCSATADFSPCFYFHWCARCSR